MTDNSRAILSSIGWPRKSSSALSRPIRCEAPPTRMKPWTSNIRKTCEANPHEMNLRLHHRSDPAPAERYRDKSAGRRFSTRLILGRMPDARVMKIRQLFSIASLICFVLLMAPLRGQAQQRASSISVRSAGNAQIFPVDELRPGMKGVGRSVFSGSAPEEFGVEIIGVLPGFTGPRQSTIIAKLTGKNVDRTGVFAGMSGSPVFVDGRLVGAVAYSFPFAKEPICGITPIE